MASRLRLMSANLLNGGAAAQVFAELVTALGADVVAVQEVTPEQAAALTRALPYGSVEPACDHTGMGIALRRPGTMRRMPLGRSHAAIADLDPVHWPGALSAIEVINVHIAAPHLLPFFETMRRRRDELRRLEEYLDGRPQHARVLLGDLNSTPLWPLYRRLTSRLTDAAADAARRRGVRSLPTWGPWPGGPRLARIDHALVNGVTVEGFQVVRIDGSDHSAIVLDVSA